MDKITLLQNKRIVLGVTGSIAVYKAVDLASKLTQAGALVDVIMTEGARQFVTPITFQSVTGRPVYTDLWQADSSGGLPTHIAHVGLGEGADLLVVAPATANTLAKLAHGLADGLLTVTSLAARCPMMIAPAMDGGMYQHPATQANIETLVSRGVYLIEPEEGRFASGLVGKGRFPETPTLIGHIRRVLGTNGLLAGRKVVVTAGGTREPIDPVRYISNRSSGKQGYAVAGAAVDAGADVILISTVHDLPTPVGATADSGGYRRGNAQGCAGTNCRSRCPRHGGSGGRLPTSNSSGTEDQEKRRLGRCAHYSTHPKPGHFAGGQGGAGEK